MAQLSVGQKADTVATFRFMSVFLMEALARWTPQTPELEVKVLFGRHLWEFAQHADVLGQRTAELRAGLHYTRPPVTEYRQVVDECSSFEKTSDRVGSIYDVLVPDLARRYAECLRDSDPLLRSAHHPRDGADPPGSRGGSRWSAARCWPGPPCRRRLTSGPDRSWPVWRLTTDFVDFRPVSLPGSTTSAAETRSVMSSGWPRKTVQGVTLAADPAREPCFTVVHTDGEMQDWPDISIQSRQERLHRHMNNELGALEIAAQCLVDFADTPWDLKMCLARQASDEARHAALLYRRLRELNGYKGQFPIANYEWGVTG